MGRRCLGQLLIRWKGASDLVELRLALDSEQDNFRATASPALERPAIERRPVVLRVFSSRKGTVRRWPVGHIASSGRPLRPQAAEPGASCAISIMTRTVAVRPAGRLQAIAQSIASKSTDGMASIAAKAQDVE